MLRQVALIQNVPGSKMSVQGRVIAQDEGKAKACRVRESESETVITKHSTNGVERMLRSGVVR